MHLNVTFYPSWPEPAKIEKTFNTLQKGMRRGVHRNMFCDTKNGIGACATCSTSELAMFPPHSSVSQNTKIENMPLLLLQIYNFYPSVVHLEERADSQPIGRVDRPALSQTETHTLGFLSVADTDPSTREHNGSQDWQLLNGNAVSRRLFGRRFEPRCGQYGSGAAAGVHRPGFKPPT